MRKWFSVIKESATLASDESALAMVENIGQLESCLASMAARVEGKPVVILDFLLFQAKALRTSDIYVEPLGEKIRIRFRIDGHLHTVGFLPNEIYPQFVNKAKVDSALIVYRDDLPQEGKIRRDFNGEKLEVRLSIVPTVKGEQLVFRLFQGNALGLNLQNLGFTSEFGDRLSQIAQQRQGTFIISGPSGCGKTTTLYALLNHIQKERGDYVHILTVEDQVECVLDDIAQIQVLERNQFGFSEALKFILRQDPDVIMVGELRDLETATALIRAGLTGHFSLASLHTSSCLQIVPRLLELGVPPHLLSGSLSALANQRLVRRTCLNCHGKMKDCLQCHGTRFCGRIPIGEIYIPSEKFRHEIAKQSPISVLQEIAAQENFFSLADEGKRAVFAGRTTMEELEKVL